jgi:GNAT superfamily N-acetyltransferase
MCRAPSASREPLRPDPDGPTTVHAPALPYRVRPARPGDARAIATVHVASWQQAFAGLLPDRFLADLSVDRRTDDWSSWIDGPPTHHVLVVEREAPDAGDGDAHAHAGDIVGLAHAGPSRDHDASSGTGELYTIYLLADTWGLGLGTVLQDAILTRLSADGCDAVTLWVLGTNTRARRFYQRRGWRQDAGERTQEFGGSVVTDYRYVRPLSADQIFSRPSQ